MALTIIDRWDEDSSEGHERYATVEFDDYSKVDVKTKEDGFAYVMCCGNGYEVYQDTDDGFRDLTSDETDEVLDFVAEWLERESEVIL